MTPWTDHDARRNRRIRLDVDGLKPSPVTRAELDRASLVVTFACQLDDAPPGLAIQRWDDVPAVSEDFERARDAIAARVRTLVDQIGVV